MVGTAPGIGFGVALCVAFVIGAGAAAPVAGRTGIGNRVPGPAFKPRTGALVCGAVGVAETAGAVFGIGSGDGTPGINC